MLYSLRYPNRNQTEAEPDAVQQTQKEETTEAPQVEAIPPALAVINAAETVDDLTPLPGIGKGAAKIILEQRPEGGYASLGNLPDQIMKHPYNVTMDGVVGWEGA